MILFKKLNYYNIAKCYMETSATSRPKPQNKPSAKIEEEIIVDQNAPQLPEKYKNNKPKADSSSPEQVSLPQPRAATTDQFDKELEALYARSTPKKKVIEQPESVSADIPNRIISPPHNYPMLDNVPLYQKPILSKESLMADIAYREVVKQVDDVGIALSKDLTKNKELADDWRKHIHALDAYIKSLQGLPWTKMLSYSACFLLVGTFIWKMGALRVLPDFLGTVIKLIPTSGISSTTIQETAAELPKPNVTSTINAIAESPVAVFGIVAGVSMGVICMGLMKITVLALKRLPK